MTVGPTPSVILSERSESKDPCISPARPKHPVILSDPERSEGESKDPDAVRLTTTACTLLAAILLFALFAAPAHAQGCAQCLDSTRATPPAVQAAYRHAIELLGGFAVALFLAGLYLLRREP